ncbi:MULTISPECIES: hypothetical protein [Pseudomonas]|uniref:hypothetical protein n=1 Tax=Pseudomonas sp. MIL9 TaxID=2807620 RepID=UPI001029F516|nr:hypothetical protein [Pseudomonas sp. MIL9]MBM6446768.1 hypothetical protein [Pseudomonas sp. MIL9]RZO05637.1 hypothetical protein EKG40_21080 [Pseudomonas moorei]
MDARLTTQEVLGGRLLLLLPTAQAASSLEQTAVPLLLVMPVATVVLGLMLKEIEQRKRTELALQLRESRLRAITESHQAMLISFR